MITICQKVFDSTFLACPRVLCFNFQIFVVGNQIIFEDPFSTPLAQITSALSFSHHFYSDSVVRQTKLSMFRVIESNFGFPLWFSSLSLIFKVVLSHCCLVSFGVFTMCRLVYPDMV